MGHTPEGIRSMNAVRPVAVVMHMMTWPRTHFDAVKQFVSNNCNVATTMTWKYLELRNSNIWNCLCL